jgi:predicted nucleic acid-binding protein
MVAIGVVESVVTDDIEAEWRRAVDYDYPRSVSPARVRRSVVEALLRASRRVDAAALPEAVPADPADAIYVAAASAGAATHLLTWDEAHLIPLDGAWPFRLQTPGAFVAALRAARGPGRRR